MRAAALRNVFAPHSPHHVDAAAQRRAADARRRHRERRGHRGAPWSARCTLDRSETRFHIQREAEEQMESAARRDSTTEDVVTF